MTLYKQVGGSIVLNEDALSELHWRTTDEENGVIEVATFDGADIVWVEFKKMGIT